MILTIKVLMTLTWFGIAGAAEIPAELVLRHARDLIPIFLEAQSSIFGQDLAVDLDSLVVSPPVVIYVPHGLSLSELDGSPALFTQREAECRRVDGYLPGPRARAVFFVRTAGQRFRLSRTCTPGDERPPRLAVELPGPRFETFGDAQILELARPLLARWPARNADVARGLQPRVTRPWFILAPMVTDYQNIFDASGSPRDCRTLTWHDPGSQRGQQVSLRIDYDETEWLTRIPDALQRVFADPVALRHFRLALVDGCGWWSRDSPPPPAGPAR